MAAGGGVSVLCTIFRETLLLSLERRGFHCSVSSFGLSKAKSSRKIQRKTESMMQKKVLGRMSKKKFYYSPMHLSSPSNSLKHQQALRLGLTKRLQQVGSLVHENVSALINSGTLGDDLVKYGVEISKVEIPPDFNCINISWLASGVAEKDDKINSLLQEHCYKMRHELTQLRVLANVPKINFLKDLTVARYAEIEQLLKIADMGTHEDTNTSEDIEDEELHGDLSEITLRSDLYDVDYETMTRQVNTRKQKLLNRFCDSVDSVDVLDSDTVAKSWKLVQKRKHAVKTRSHALTNTHDWTDTEVVAQQDAELDVVEEWDEDVEFESDEDDSGPLGDRHR